MPQSSLNGGRGGEADAALDSAARESEEKSLLLSELRHRMKNNLQAVQSLLCLRKARTQNAAIRRELAHLEVQISALNGVDGELLVAEAQRSIDLGAYLRRLLAKLKTAFGSDAGRVSFRIELEAVQVSCRAAANIGLLVNEAVTNSFKHAVPKGAREIRICLKRAQDAAILCLSDDGPGFQGAGPRHAGGTLLMKRLAERGGATIERDADRPGAHYTVRLPAPPAAMP